MNIYITLMLHKTVSVRVLYVAADPAVSSLRVRCVCVSAALAAAVTQIYIRGTYLYSWDLLIFMGLTDEKLN